MWSVYKLFREAIPLWPPDGCLMMVGIFMSIIVCHLVVLLVGVIRIIVWKIREFISSLDRSFTKYQYVLQGMFYFYFAPRNPRGLHIK